MFKLGIWMILGYPTFLQVMWVWGWKIRVNSNTAWVRTPWVPSSFICECCGRRVIQPVDHHRHRARIAARLQTLWVEWIYIYIFDSWFAAGQINYHLLSYIPELNIEMCHSCWTVIMACIDNNDLQIWWTWRIQGRIQGVAGIRPLNLPQIACQSGVKKCSLEREKLLPLSTVRNRSTILSKAWRTHPNAQCCIVINTKVIDYCNQLSYLRNCNCNWLPISEQVIIILDYNYN